MFAKILNPLEKVLVSKLDAEERVHFVFRKKNGEIRQACGTRNQIYIHAVKTSPIRIGVPEASIHYFDHDCAGVISGDYTAEQVRRRVELAKRRKTLFTKSGYKQKRPFLDALIDNLSEEDRNLYFESIPSPNPRTGEVDPLELVRFYGVINRLFSKEDAAKLFDFIENGGHF